jgi:hypothetical protein
MSILLKIIFKQILLRTILVVVLSLVIFVGVLYIKNYRPCCGDAGASIQAWQDLNGNGKIDRGENPLPGVCAWDTYIDDMSVFPQTPYTEADIDSECSFTFQQTDAKGWWGEFKAGGNCTELYLFALPPKGYQATTSSVVNGCDGQFGFQPIGSQPARTGVTPVEFIQEKIRESNLRTDFVLFAAFIISIGLSFIVLPVRRKITALQESR